MTDHLTEQDVIHTAQAAISSCNWTVGECAGVWCEKYAKGRTDADFGSLVGLSGDQVYKMRRVAETFPDSAPVRNLDGLKWSHFYGALNWDDFEECLNWASENQATVAEMKAWRRMQHGEDLTVDAEEHADPVPAPVIFPSSLDSDFEERMQTSAWAGTDSGDSGPGLAEASAAISPADLSSQHQSVSVQSPGTEDSQNNGLQRAEQAYAPFRSGSRQQRDEPSPLSGHEAFRKARTRLLKTVRAMFRDFPACRDLLRDDLDAFAEEIRQGEEPTGLDAPTIDAHLQESAA